LFAGNLPFQLDDNELFLLFTNNGIHVSWAQVKRDQNGRSKGMGIVSVSPRHRDEAIRLNGANVMGRQIKVAIYKLKRGLTLSAKEKALFSHCGREGTLAAQCVATIFRLRTQHIENP
jgi:RNA recognition motif-containing protein